VGPIYKREPFPSVRGEPLGGFLFLYSSSVHF
jgi:hypothetical protein